LQADGGFAREFLDELGQRSEWVTTQSWEFFAALTNWRARGSIRSGCRLVSGSLRASSAGGGDSAGRPAGTDSAVFRRKARATATAFQAGHIHHYGEHAVLFVVLNLHRGAGNGLGNGGVQLFC